MWKYRIDRGRGLVITTAWGLLTTTDVLEHRRQLRSDPFFRRSFHQLVDLTRVEGVALDFNTVDKLSREHLFSRKSRRAFVTSRVLTEGIVRMFISLRALAGGTERMEVFENRNKAVRWLCKPDAKIAPYPHLHFVPPGISPGKRRPSITAH